MSDESPQSAVAPRAVFLSYASQDIAAALCICHALRAAGVEVWFDQNELGGGDGWDRKIRGQIKECALFVPVISAATQARLEGYFRLEWKLAAQRTYTMADAKPFLLPIVIDATRDADAHVPDEFRAVQWMRLPAGEASAAFCARVLKLLGSEVAPVSDRRFAGSPENPAGQRPALPRKGSSHSLLTPALLTLAAAVTLVLWQPWKIPTALPPRSELPPADLKSIAVLAFADMSANKDAEYFSDGISEEILNALDRIPTLRVTPRTSSFSFKGKNVALDEIGRALRVASVIEGSVRKAGNRVKITVKLLNAADGSRVWAEEFDRELTPTAIFALQGEIAAKVAHKLGGGSVASASGATAPTGGQTPNLSAYDAYLRARALQTGGQSEVTMLGAVKLYEEAVRHDSGYALAWARLSQAFMRMHFGFDRSARTGEQARKAAIMALELAPDLPEAHLAMAAIRLFVEFDHAATQRELDEAERLRPNNPDAPALRVQLETARGNWSEELAGLIARGVELDPHNANSLSSMGTTLSLIGSFAQADELQRRSWALSKASTTPVRSRAMNVLAWIGDVGEALEIMESTPERLRASGLFSRLRGDLHSMLGNFAAARADYEQTRQFATAGAQKTSGPRNGLLNATYGLGRLEARHGNTVRAAELFAETLAGARQYVADFADAPGASVLGVYNVARAHAGRGEKTAALAASEEALRIVARTHDAAEIARARRAKAEVLAELGEIEAAVAELRVVHEMGYAFGYTLRVELEWEPLRGNAKFQQLMKEAEARADAQPRPKN